MPRVNHLAPQGATAWDVDPKMTKNPLATHLYSRVHNLSLGDLSGSVLSQMKTTRCQLHLVLNPRTREERKKYQLKRDRGRKTWGEEENPKHQYYNLCTNIRVLKHQYHNSITNTQKTMLTRQKTKMLKSHLLSFIFFPFFSFLFHF